MTQCIDKSVVLEEIEKLKGQLLYGACSSQIAMETRCKEEAYDEEKCFWPENALCSFPAFICDELMKASLCAKNSFHFTNIKQLA